MPSFCRFASYRRQVACGWRLKSPASSSACPTAYVPSTSPSSFERFDRADPTAKRSDLSGGRAGLRKGFEGLSAIVRGQWKMDLFAEHLFVFVGRCRDRCKVLFWDRGGLVVYYKRLEQGRFRLPQRAADGRSIEMDSTELAMLLDGLDFGRVKKPARWTPAAWHAG
jgi:transposase